jgi:hypothetical protein
MDSYNLIWAINFVLEGLDMSDNRSHYFAKRSL